MKSVRGFLPHMTRLALAILSFLVVGCVGPARIARPSDFPLHAADHPFFDLHWRIDRRNGIVLAVGLVEAARVSGIAEVTLELRGIDAGGQVISRSRGSTYGGPLFRGDSRPFTVRLRPRGQEDHFELSVWSFTWDTRGEGGERGQ